MKKIFVSFPYSHKNKRVIASRIKFARTYCNQLLQQGHAIFCPALFGHDLITRLKLTDKEQDMTFNAWKDFCFAYLEPCDEFHLLQLKGYEKSIGCGEEELQAIMLKKTIVKILIV